MSLGKFSDVELARMRLVASDEPAALHAVIERLREIANLDGHSYGAVRLASEALRALGAEVPLCRSEI